jgi:hypothetical protein
MAGCRSTPEIEQEHLRAFGPGLGPIYHALHMEVLWLTTKWLEYRKLYAGSAQRIDLLNATAPFFFHMIQGILWEDVVLHIARLTDPARQGSFNNLTLLQLPDAVPNPQLAEATRGLVKIAVAKAGFARIWRDKRLAHCDLDYALERAAALPAASRQDVEDVLASYQAVVNGLHGAYLESRVAFGHVCVGAGDADGLVYNLAEARQVEDRRQQRAREGTSIAEDFEQPTVP